MATVDLKTVASARSTTRPSSNMEYVQYLQSPRWRTIRIAVRLRAKGRCEICRRNPGREAAHITYERIFREPMEDLLWLCPSCHRDLDQAPRESTMPPHPPAHVGGRGLAGLATSPQPHRRPDLRHRPGLVARGHRCQRDRIDQVVVGSGAVVDRVA